ncbi:hypothetical protein HK102_005134, partial [Quaeritorhiza haematococci]
LHHAGDLFHQHVLGSCNIYWNSSHITSAAANEDPRSVFNFCLDHAPIAPERRDIAQEELQEQPSGKTASMSKANERGSVHTNMRARLGLEDKQLQTDIFHPPSHPQQEPSQMEIPKIAQPPWNRRALSRSGMAFVKEHGVWDSRKRFSTLKKLGGGTGCGLQRRISTSHWIKDPHDGVFPILASKSSKSKSNPTHTYYDLPVHGYLLKPLPQFGLGTLVSKIVSPLYDLAKTEKERARLTSRFPWFLVGGLWFDLPHPTVFFVSGSPWHLHGDISAFFRPKFFPTATLNLRDLFILDGSAFSLASNEATYAYKLQTIQGLAKRLGAKRTLVMLGNSTQKDPEVYGNIARWIAKGEEAGAAEAGKKQPQYQQLQVETLEAGFTKPQLPGRDATLPT